jgi:hypothetical protein
MSGPQLLNIRLSALSVSKLNMRHGRNRPMSPTFCPRSGRKACARPCWSGARATGTALSPDGGGILRSGRSQMKPGAT